MRFPRLLIAALALAVTLTACSGEDSEGEAPEEEGSASQEGASPGSTNRETTSPIEQRSCSATVEVSGAVEASWEGEATARGREGSGTVFHTAQGKKTVTAYAKGEGIPPSVNFFDGTRVFATRPGDGTGLDIRPSGKLAEVDAEAVDVDGQTVRIVTSFVCKNPGKK